MDIKKIKKVSIYPAIGIARIGNSKEYFLASEIPGVAPSPEGGFKDGNNLFKKQVPLFRIYGLDEHGNTLGEITADIADIEWRVHTANRKAAWYQFNNALDLGVDALPSTPRNGDMSGDDRQNLVIDAGIVKIKGRDTSGPAYQLDKGQFFDKKISLGEIRTDHQGRLLVFGGDGISESRTGIPAITFANNDGWHDDVSDGTVRATLTIGGVTFEADPAMVVCTPPNFGPGLFPVVTMYDVAYDLFVREKWMEGPQQVTFYDNIFPIFQRMSNAQWVNEGFFMLFGTNSPSDFNNPELIKVLSNPAPEHAEERRRIFSWFRNTASDSYQPDLIPPYYGDLFGDYEKLPHVDLSVTATQYQMLQSWAEGSFTTGSPAAPVPFEKMNPQQQTEALLKVSLEECLGGPFHPGIEITWPFRQLIMWDKPFRLRILPEEVPVSDNYGPMITGEIALSKNGPLDGSGPGSLTRWLGVPWQTDEASCLSGYDTTLYLPLPSFWATRVPNTVLSMKSYNRATKKSLDTGQRLKHFSYRVDWLRDFAASYVGRINNMVALWHELGVISKHSDAANTNPYLPSEWWVETDRKDGEGEDPTYHQVLRAEREPEAKLLQGNRATRQTKPLKRHEL
ncbi:LodA/GoxA family CTQ-dependent oxidase [Pedobacter sp. L105]|uniref:LodA/GoxA family CTQ-dependent oxidase n=1 Tax=Pedobacter sp. L105 TaxID=1641871 RepID=UPI00131D26F8|nr:LodA/GoxA family CTQ-dependent oxidase [Pedobacter sp. L105]